MTKNRKGCENMIFISILFSSPVIFTSENGIKMNFFKKLVDEQ